MQQLSATCGRSQLTRVAVACSRSFATGKGSLPRQAAAAPRQLAQSGFLGAGQCTPLAGSARRLAGGAQQGRGFRTTTVMGLKTGIVGLPNVGKVRCEAVDALERREHAFAGLHQPA